MTTEPARAPTEQQIDAWCEHTGYLKAVAARSFVPGHGIDVTACIVGYTLPNGSDQYMGFPGQELDPLSNIAVKAQIKGLLDQFGTDGVRIRKYAFTQRMGAISPFSAAASHAEQNRLNDPGAWRGDADALSVSLLPLQIKHPLRINPSSPPGKDAEGGFLRGGNEDRTPHDLWLMRPAIYLAAPTPLYLAPCETGMICSRC